MGKEKTKILSIRLGAQASLDLVWQDDICLVIFAERGAIHNRKVARLHPDQAMEAARFLAKVDPLPPAAPPVEEEITKP